MCCVFKKSILVFVQISLNHIILTHHEARISSEIIKRRNKIRNKTLETKLRVNIYPIACRFMDKQIARRADKGLRYIYMNIYVAVVTFHIHFNDPRINNTYRASIYNDYLPIAW